MGDVTSRVRLSQRALSRGRLDGEEAQRRGEGSRAYGSSAAGFRRWYVGRRGGVVVRGHGEMWGVCSFRGQTVLACVVIVPPWRRAPPVRDFRGIPSHLPVGARPNSLWEGGATVRPSRGLSPKPRSPPGGSGVHDSVRHKNQAMMPPGPSQGFAPPHLLAIPAEEAGALSPPEANTRRTEKFYARATI